MRIVRSLWEDEDEDDDVPRMGAPAVGGGRRCSPAAAARRRRVYARQKAEGRVDGIRLAEPYEYKDKHGEPTPCLLCGRPVPPIGKLKLYCTPAHGIEYRRRLKTAKGLAGWQSKHWSVAAPGSRRA